jgi:hypothetical protein
MTPPPLKGENNKERVAKKTQILYTVKPTTNRIIVGEYSQNPQDQREQT